MKPANVKPDFYAKYNVYSNEKHPKFIIGNHVSISKYKKILTKESTRHWSGEDFVISKIINTLPWT